jgi:hypothetical protein
LRDDVLTVFDRRAAVCCLPTNNPCHDRIDQKPIAHPGGDARYVAQQTA